MRSIRVSSWPVRRCSLVALLLRLRLPPSQHEGHVATLP